MATTSAVFGDAVDAEALWSEISKMSPGPEAVHAPGVAFVPTRRKRKQPVTKRRELTPQEKQERLEQNVARASNAVGLTAGGAAIGTTMRDPRLKEGGRASRAIYRAGEKMPKPIERATRKIGPKGAAALAGGAFALQAGNVAGDVITARVLGRDKTAGTRPVAGAHSSRPHAVVAAEHRARKDPVAKASLGALIRGWRKTSEMQAQAVMPGMQKTPRPVGQGLGPKTAKPKVEATPIQQRRWDTKAAQRSQAAAAGKATRMQTQAPGVVSRHGGVQGVQEKLGALRATQGKASVSPQQRFIAAGQGAKQDLNSMLGTTSGKVAAGTIGVGAVGSLVSRRNRNSGGYDPYAGFGKADTDDLEFYAPISKLDDDKRLAFGWASVVSKNGLPVLDRQGDYIGIDDVEDAAYVYVEKSRVGGHMHKRTMGKADGEDAPHHVADMVESMVFTPEKIAKMGLPEDFPTGWWVGYRVFDDDVWEAAKSGELTGFSIHGKGIRKSVDYDELMGAGR